MAAKRQISDKPSLRVFIEDGQRFIATYSGDMARHEPRNRMLRSLRIAFAGQGLRRAGEHVWQRRLPNYRGILVSSPEPGLDAVVSSHDAKDLMRHGWLVFEEKSVLVPADVDGMRLHPRAEQLLERSLVEAGMYLTMAEIDRLSDAQKEALAVWADAAMLGVPMDSPIPYSLNVIHYDPHPDDVPASWRERRPV